MAWPVKLEWSAAALADLDRFEQFLRREYPLLKLNWITLPTSFIDQGAPQPMGTHPALIVAEAIIEAAPVLEDLQSSAGR
jgi:hypothetical protein